MATASKLVEEMAAATGKPFAMVRMKARRLIDDKELPKAIGSRIPQINHDHAALLLFAVAVAELVNDSTRVARTYAGLTYNGYSTADAPTALEAVSKLLRDIPHNVNALDWSLEICRSWPEVVVNQPRPGPQNQTSTGSIMDSSWYIERGKNPQLPPPENFKEITLIPGICLYRIALALADES
jgi:hypothetical protein